MKNEEHVAWSSASAMSESAQRAMCGTVCICEYLIGVCILYTGAQTTELDYVLLYICIHLRQARTCAVCTSCNCASAVALFVPRSLTMIMPDNNEKTYKTIRGSGFE